MLSAKNQAKVDKMKEVLNNKGIIFEEKANGQLNIDKISFWATTDKWYDPATGNKGLGINSLLMYIEAKNKPSFDVCKDEDNEEKDYGFKVVNGFKLNDTVLATDSNDMKLNEKSLEKVRVSIDLNLIKYWITECNLLKELDIDTSMFM